ncbi:MAG: IclR family transcriptional regulator [Haloechinothrix sp.]
MTDGSLTLDRGLALLQAVADAEVQACSVSELAERVGVSRAAVYRLLAPLVDRGLVWRDGTKVRLGVGLLRLASRVLPQLRDAAAPVLRELAEAAGATAHLSIADADMVQAVAVIEPTWTSYHVAYRVGTRHPITKGAAGKAITLRQGGVDWASTAGELQPGAFGVAAPVRGVTGLRASIGVISFNELDADVVGPRLVAAAARLARVLA